MSSEYVELHAKSFSSFGEGASHVHELIARAAEFGYPALVAIRHNSTIDRSLRHILPNDRMCMKSGAEMRELFADCPEAVANTMRIAERCEFDLSSDLGYALPEPDDTPRRPISRGYATRPQAVGTARLRSRWSAGFARSSA